MRLLLVEDDLDTRDLLAELLSEDYEVDVAASFEQARVAFDRHQHPLVVTDYTLPGGTGAELAEAIKAIGDTRVLLLTGHKNPPGTDACDLVLQKPVEIDELLAGLRSLTQRPSGEDHVVPSAGPHLP